MLDPEEQEWLKDFRETWQGTRGTYRYLLNIISKLEAEVERLAYHERLRKLEAELDYLKKRGPA